MGEHGGNRYDAGLHQWQDGHLLDAANTFREVIRQASPGDTMRGEYHGSLGGVLSALGQDEAALHEYQEALRIAFDSRGDNATVPVAVARYFVAEHLLKMSRPRDALSIVSPSLSALPTRPEPLLRMVEAEALWRLGQRGAAIRSAQRAIETASPGTQRDRIKERLGTILSEENPGGGASTGAV
jgi:hypothetical protein